MTTRNFDHRNDSHPTTGAPQNWTTSTRRHTDPHPPRGTTHHGNAGAYHPDNNQPTDAANTAANTATITAPTTSTEPNSAATTAGAPLTLPISDPDRRSRLLAYAPRVPPELWTPVRQQVLTAVAATPFASRGEDTFRLSTLTHYAIWCHRADGEFTHARHMNEQQFVRYLAHGMDHKSRATRNTTLSGLRRIRDRTAPKKNRMRRPPISAPYTAREWANLVRAADALIGTLWHPRLLMAMDLTGSGGLRPDEALKARGIDLAPDGDAVLLDVADENAVVRRIPFFDDAATRLRPHVGKNEHLLWPEHANRRNAISDIKAKTRTHNPAIATFDSARARNTYLARLMQMHLPTRTVAYLAGVNPGTHTLEDLTAHIPAPSSHDAAESVRAARTWKEDHPWS